MEGKVVAISISEKKGVKKVNVGEALLVEDRGIEGDAHAGPGIRQVSLLALESIEKMIATGLEVTPGDFAENITVQGLELLSLPLGQNIQIGESVRLQVTQIGKTCHDRCAIYYSAGDCVMPREGIFCKVIAGGKVRPGDTVTYV